MSAPLVHNQKRYYLERKKKSFKQFRFLLLSAKKQAKYILYCECGGFPPAKVSVKLSSIGVGLNLGFQNTPSWSSGGAVCKFVVPRAEAANKCIGELGNQESGALRGGRKGTWGKDLTFKLYA